MPGIHVLAPEVIDKIAAGEVVNRPVNVVKELCENALDAGARALTIEIRNGGIDLIRITDDGSGIPAGEVKNAFLRHATSKLTKEEELSGIRTLGFRGEALSSIAAVAKVELISRERGVLFGSRYVIEGGKENEPEEIGAPEGTTIIVRELFFNTPARRKFLKQPGTEAGSIGQLLEGLALARPEVSFKFLQDGKVRLQTSGSGEVKEVIYRFYGRQTARDLIPIEACAEGMAVHGFLGLPGFLRSNRNFELYFANGRLVQDKVIRGAIEEGYQGRLMQHKFPFCVLYLDFDPGEIDVNVHPAKLEIRIRRAAEFFSFLSSAIRETLQQKERIPEITVSRDFPEHPEGNPAAVHPESSDRNDPAAPSEAPRDLRGDQPLKALPEPFELERRKQLTPLLKEETRQLLQDAQPSAEPKLPAFLTPEGERRESFRLIGQLYETYWLIQSADRLYFLDQHAAHEKVNYERLCKKLLNGSIYSQNLLPPLILRLSALEEEVLQRFLPDIEALGFVIEPFGGADYALRAVPAELWGMGERELFLAVLDELSEEGGKKAADGLIRNKIASMACKASVKGNMSMTEEEVRALFAEMMELEDPFHCPHGRPTLILVTKSELEKKFGRIQQ